MDPITQGYEQIIDRFTRWAQDEEYIRAALLIGSRARKDHPADEFSDLDIIVVADPVDPYIKGAEWIEAMGKPWLTFIEAAGGGDSPVKERRVLYEGGLDVDYALFPASIGRAILDHGIPPDMADMLKRGSRNLVDKDGLLDQIKQLELPSEPPAPPTEQEFNQVVHDFLFHTVWSAKHLRRGELWWAKSCVDEYMKHLLRVMLEWHARSTRGQDYDTWMRGRFLEEWADPRALIALRGIFAQYEEEDIWRALFNTMNLFRWLAVETASQLDLAYPTSSDEDVTKLVMKLFAEKF